MTKSRWQFRLLAALALVTGSIAAGSPALAGSFQVNPVNLAIPPERATTSLSLQNTGSEPVSVRMVTYLWTQEGGKDVYSETSNVIASPPIFTLEVGETQLVRVGLKDRRPGEAYRIVFEEIPRDNLEGNVIQVALRLNLPLFVEAEKGESSVRWQAWRDASGALTLAAENIGSRHQKITGVELDREAGEDRLLSEEVGVVLPSSIRRWDLGSQPDIAAGSAISLTIRTPAGEVQQQVVVQQR